jgi:rare lipoprotein A
VSRRPPSTALAAALIAALGALGGPALALASGGSGVPSGGAAPSGSSASSGSTGSSGSSGDRSPTVGSANLTVTASGDGISLATRSGAMLRTRLRFTGTAANVPPGDVVEIERRGHQTGWRWEPTVHATPAASGSFSAVWRTNHIGQFAIRAVVEPARAGASQASTAPASPAVTVIVYRPSEATLYGPGLYGRLTACGERLTRRTIGLANRTLPCGTRVALEYDGRTLVVPVIDRGPYGTIADWDLTMATGRALGMPGTEWIGAVSLRR